jgi:hypothetical protein
MLLYVVCTAGESVYNEGGDRACYLLPAPYITMCDFYLATDLILQKPTDLSLTSLNKLEILSQYLQPFPHSP